MEVRSEVDKLELTQSKEVFLNAFKLKLSREFDMAKKLTAIQSVSSQEQMQLIQTVETAKTSDAILDKFDFDLTHLMHGIKHFELEQCEEMKKFAQLIQMQQQAEIKKLLATITPDKDQINAMTTEATNLGKPELKADGLMTFDFFIAASKIQ